MGSTEDFENIIKQKLAGQEFPFNESNWEKASALIDADRKKKKRRLILFWFLGGILLIGGISFVLFSPSQTTQYSKTNSVQQKTPPSEIKTGTETSENNISVNHNDNSTNSTVVSNENKISDKNTAIKTISTTAITPVQNTKKENKARSKHIKNNSSTYALSSTTVMNVNTIASTNTLINQDNKTDKTIESNTSNITPVNEQKSNEPISSIIDNSPIKTTGLDTITVKDSLHLVAKDSLIKDSLTTVASTDSMPEITPKKNSLEIVMGAAWSMPWTNDVKGFGKGLSPVAGISYERKLGSHYAVSCGLQFNSFYNRSNKPFVYTTTTYGFGKTTHVQTIDVNNMQYLTVPIRFIYPAQQKGNFSIGVNLCYLMDTKIKNTEYTGRALGGSSTITTFQSGVYKGLNSFDTQLAIAYRRKFQRKFNVQLEYFYGLTDLFDNKTLGVNSFERNKGIKLTLGYELFRK